MAPQLQSTPRLSVSTRRCALSSSSSSPKESTGGSLLHRQIRRFFFNSGDCILQFRPPSTSSGQTEHTSGFPKPGRILDALVFVPSPSSPSTPASIRHGFFCPRAPPWSALIGRDSGLLQHLHISAVVRPWIPSAAGPSSNPRVCDLIHPFSCVLFQISWAEMLHQAWSLFQTNIISLTQLVRSLY
jgi:hypothetical protein